MFVVAANVPAAQAVHTVTFASEKDPAAHTAQPVEPFPRNEPASQAKMKHDAEPAAAPYPATHALHVVAFVALAVVENVFAAHRLQALAPAAEYEPAGQPKQGAEGAVWLETEE